MQQAIHVYDNLLDIGHNYGIRHAGYFALRWLRIEKFYAYWGEDFGYKNTPLEIGREMRVKFDKVRIDGVWCPVQFLDSGAARLLLYIREDEEISLIP